MTAVVYVQAVEVLMRPPRAEPFWLSLLWRIEITDDAQTRRTLIDPQTGEILDDVWPHPERHVTSYNAFDRTALRAPYRRDARLVKAVEADVLRRRYDQVVNDRRDDRSLPRQGQLFPTPT